MNRGKAILLFPSKELKEYLRWGITKPQQEERNKKRFIKRMLREAEK